jgi:hypothetical protein
MSYQTDIANWSARAELYRQRGMAVEAIEGLSARQIAARIVNTEVLAEGAIQGIVQVHQKANAAARDHPGVEFAARHLEATVQMGLSEIVARYMLG